MKEVKLQKAGDRGRSVGRRRRRRRSKGLFWRLEGPVYNRQLGNTQLRAFEVPGSVCAGVLALTSLD